MECDAEQAALGRGINRKVECWTLQHSIDYALNFPGRLLKDEELIWTDEGQTRRLIESTDHLCLQ